MAINFSRTIMVTPCDEAEVAATRLEAELTRLFSKGSQFGQPLIRRAPWVLSDESSTSATGRTVVQVFSEFRAHGLQPDRLRTEKHGAAGTLGEIRFWLYVRYSITRKEIELVVWGPDRVTVDGVAAHCERIRDRLQQPPASAAESAAPQGRPRPSWLARTWRDHAASLVVGILASLIAAALALWFGLGSG